MKYRGIVQSVEHQSPKLGVVGSSPSAPAKKKADCESNLLFSVIFACGEFYCFAVIFGLRRVIFASRVLEANRISLKPQGFNITIAISDNITPTKSEYNSCFLCRFVI